MPPAAWTLEWSASELQVIRSLALTRLGPPPASPGNAFADDPRAQALGARFFHDARLSRDGRVSCASCHQSSRQFTDGLPAPLSLTGRKRHTPTLLGAAWSRWQFWDGRADSLWAQAIQPLTDPLEHGLDPLRLQALIARHYRDDYESVFGRPVAGDPLWVAARVGKALEAFQRQLRPAPTRFDRYVAQLAPAVANAALTGTGSRPMLSVPLADVALTQQEREGLRVFIGRGQCVRCHLGPLLTNHGFANTGIAARVDDRADGGRADGITRALTDPFNCAGPYSSASAAQCGHLQHARVNAPEWLGAFKVPTLRGIAGTAPYMHDGRFATLEQVIDHYRHAPNQDGDYGHTELFPLRLDEPARAALVAFLKTL